MNIARVITDLALDRKFDYLVPERLRGQLKVGMAVEVPFGTGRKRAYVLQLSNRSDVKTERLKEILGLHPDGGHLPEKLVELGCWMAQYYCCSTEQAIRALLPAAVRRRRAAKIVRRYCLSEPEKLDFYLQSDQSRPGCEARQAIIKALAHTAEGLEIGSLKLIPDFNDSALRTLLRRKVVRVECTKPASETAPRVAVAPSAPPELTADQKHALSVFGAMLDKTEPRRVMLLAGVTNSGKTEVYMQMIQQVLERGKSAIVLVPEISLTPQTVRRFQSRFGTALAVLHSRLTDAERAGEWDKISCHQAKIAIGARSALFAPFTDLGLIVVDEEHESSYKQSEAPRYVSRDVAVMRGKLEDALVVLGSATPCAESAHNAAIGRFVRADMPHQVRQQPPPRITVIDRRLEPPPAPGENRVFSPLLIEEVRRKVENGEQCILYLNRRGYSRSLNCPVCNYEFCCPDCSLPGSDHRTPYIYRRSNQTLCCHLCGRTESAPTVCPECGNTELRYSGTGTEKIESISRGAFPFARVGRMDSDAMKKLADYERTLEAFRRGELDILIGTQMIAKGLHFPNVTLVGIVNADLGLMIPDFRASERVFQLITQVAGRSGRGDVPGEVLIQSHEPGNDTIDYASKLDFAGFSAFDLEFRQLLDYPPFSRIILLHFRGADPIQVQDFAAKIAEQLTPFLHDDVKLTGPVPAPIERIKGQYRFQIMLKGRKLRQLREAVRELALHRPIPKGVDFYVDVDPQNLL